MKLTRQDKIAVALTIALIAAYIAFRLAGGGFAAVEGRSMEPLLHTGDLVILVKKDPLNINVGDIIVYRSGAKFVIHRVIHKYEVDGRHCFVTKGDNNWSPDMGDPRKCPPSPAMPGVAGHPEENIVGVVLSINKAPLKIPYIGGITLIIKS